MRRIIFASAAAAAILLITVAAVLMLDGTDTADQPAMIPTDVPHNGTARIPQDVADANNSFAIDFYRHISGTDGNLFFSPISILVAFSALYEGAQGDTAAQMEDIFGFDPDEQARHMATSNLLTSLNRDDPHATLNMANALWIAEQYPLYDSYIHTLHNTYMAHVENVDFFSKETKVIIDQWASDNTNGKITDIFSTPDDPNYVVAVITNAIYFKGDWLAEFPKSQTREKEFWTGVDWVRTDFMMFGEAIPKFKYVQSDSVQVLHLPYKGDRLSMLIVLPDDQDGIKDLEDLFSAEMIRKWRNELRMTEVIVEIPKFEMRTNYDLKARLAAMGMPDVFDKNKSNLPDIVNNGQRIYVSWATHDAFVNVNEEGTEAAAVTAMGMKIVSGPGIPTPKFIADHPFIFIIQDEESGAILFMGKVADPTKGT